MPKDINGTRIWQQRHIWRAIWCHAGANLASMPPPGSACLRCKRREVRCKGRTLSTRGTRGGAEILADLCKLVFLQIRYWICAYMQSPRIKPKSGPKIKEQIGSLLKTFPLVFEGAFGLCKRRFWPRTIIKAFSLSRILDQIFASWGNR